MTGILSFPSYCLFYAGLVDTSRSELESKTCLQLLQEELRQFYIHELCFARTVPWVHDTAVPISDSFSAPSLVYRKKTSNCDKTSSCNPLESCRMNTFFTEKVQGEVLETINDVFFVKQNKVLPKRILISGEPGVGKSTLLLKYAFDWSVQAPESALRDVKLLIHLSLSGITEDAMLGEEIVKQTLVDDFKLTGPMIEECIRKQESDVVILLDGFDDSVFARRDSAQRNTKYGSLYKAFTFERFRGCRMVVATRPWKDFIFNSQKLFNPYTEIRLCGLTSSALHPYILNYCDEKGEERVQEALRKNYVNLRPAFHNPLFLGMICEMIANDVKVEYPFTLTKLIQELCNYLYKTRKNVKREQEVDGEHRQNVEIGLEECLLTLGRLASSSRQDYIDQNSECDKLSEEDKAVIQIGLAIGLISTSARVRRQKGRLYFFHNLLRDFCLAKSNLDQYKRFARSDIEKWLFQIILRADLINYENLFMCGLNPDMVQALEPFVQKLLNDRHFRETLISFLSRCLFETKDSRHGGDVLRYLQFVKMGCVVVELDVLNSHAAAEYLMSCFHRSSPTPIIVKNLVITGDIKSPYPFRKSTCEHKQSTTDDNKETSMSLFHYKNDMHLFRDLLLKCKSLSQLCLKGLRIACEEVVYERKNSNLRSINVAWGNDITAIEYLLKFASNELKNLNSLHLTDVLDSNNNSKTIGRHFEKIFALLCEVGIGVKAMQIGGVNDINKFVISPDALPRVRTLSLLVLELSFYDEQIDYDHLLQNLSKIPTLLKIILFDCNIDFKITKEANIQSGSSVEMLHLVFKWCKGSMKIANILFIVSNYYPRLEGLTLEMQYCDVQFGKLERPVVMHAKCKIYLIQCMISLKQLEMPNLEGKLNKVEIVNCWAKDSGDISKLKPYCDNIRFVLSKTNLIPEPESLDIINKPYEGPFVTLPLLREDEYNESVKNPLKAFSNLAMKGFIDELDTMVPFEDIEMSICLVAVHNNDEENADDNEDDENDDDDDDNNHNVTTVGKKTAYGLLIISPYKKPICMNDFSDFLSSWLPNIQYLVFGEVIDFSGKSDKLPTSKHHSVIKVEFNFNNRYCNSVLDVTRHYDMCLNLFPNLHRLEIDNCDILFPNNVPSGLMMNNNRSRIKRILIHKCRINFIDLLSLGKYLKNLHIKIRSCDIAFNCAKSFELDPAQNGVDIITIHRCRLPSNFKSLLAVGYPGYQIIDNIISYLNLNFASLDDPARDEIEELVETLQIHQLTPSESSPPALQLVLMKKKVSLRPSEKCKFL